MVGAKTVRAVFLFNEIGALAYEHLIYRTARVLRAGRNSRMSVGFEVRKATARDLEQFAKNVQSVADEGRYLFVEEVTEERKKSMGRLFKKRDCLVLVAEVGKGKSRKQVG